MAIHDAPCLSHTTPAQHDRNTIGGTVRQVIESRSPKCPGVVAFAYLAELDRPIDTLDGPARMVELGPGWWGDDCPAARPALQEAS